MTENQPLADQVQTENPVDTEAEKPIFENQKPEPVIQDEEIVKSQEPINQELPAEISSQKQPEEQQLELEKKSQETPKESENKEEQKQNNITAEILSITQVQGCAEINSSIQSPSLLMPDGSVKDQEQEQEQVSDGEGAFSQNAIQKTISVINGNHKTISMEDPAFSMQNQDDIVNENVSGFAEFSNNMQDMGSKDSPQDMGSKDSSSENKQNTNPIQLTTHQEFTQPKQVNEEEQRILEPKGQTPETTRKKLFNDFSDLEITENITVPQQPNQDSNALVQQLDFSKQSEITQMSKLDIMNNINELQEQIQKLQMQIETTAQLNQSFVQNKASQEEIAAPMPQQEHESQRQVNSQFQMKDILLSRDMVLDPNIQQNQCHSLDGHQPTSQIQVFQSKIFNNNNVHDHNGDPVTASPMKDCNNLSFQNNEAVQTFNQENMMLNQDPQSQTSFKLQVSKMSLTLAGEPTTTNGGMTLDNENINMDGEMLSNLNHLNSEVTPLVGTNQVPQVVKREIKSMKSGSIANSEQKMKCERMLDSLKMSDVKNSHLNLIDPKIEMKESFIKEKCEDSLMLDGLRIKQNDASTLNQNNQSNAARSPQGENGQFPQLQGRGFERRNNQMDQIGMLSQKLSQYSRDDFINFVNKAIVVDSQFDLGEMLFNAFSEIKQSNSFDIGSQNLFASQRISEHILSQVLPVAGVQDATLEDILCLIQDYEKQNQSLKSRQKIKSKDSKLVNFDKTDRLNNLINYEELANKQNSIIKQKQDQMMNQYEDEEASEKEDSFFEIVLSPMKSVDNDENGYQPMFHVQTNDNVNQTKEESKKKKVTFSYSPIKMVYDKNLDKMVCAENISIESKSLKQGIDGSTTISPELAAHYLANPHLLKQEILNSQNEQLSQGSENDDVKQEQDQNNELNETPQEILNLRNMYPDLIHNNNMNEENWFCDICLDADGEEDEDLVICELCLVTVHPTCYRRELYEQDPDDESPWYCQRCIYLIDKYEEDPGKVIPYNKLPNCMLCPSRCGSIIQLETKEWVHQVCVNWHNEIWFEKDDVKLSMFGGKLNLKRFEYTCSICKIPEGSCIDCDLPSCRTRFHVRCAIEAGLILSNEDQAEEQNMRLGEWDCKIFCNKHTKLGKQRVEKLKKQRERGENPQQASYQKMIRNESDEEENNSKRKTRASTSSARQNSGKNKKRIIQEVLQSSGNQEDENEGPSFASPKRATKDKTEDQENTPTPNRKLKIDYHRFDEILNRSHSKKQQVLKSKKPPTRAQKDIIEEQEYLFSKAQTEHRKQIHKIIRAQRHIQSQESEQQIGPSEQQLQENKRILQQFKKKQQEKSKEESGVQQQQTVRQPEGQSERQIFSEKEQSQQLDIPISRGPQITQKDIIRNLRKNPLNDQDPLGIQKRQKTSQNQSNFHELRPISENYPQFQPNQTQQPIFTTTQISHSINSTITNIQNRNQVSFGINPSNGNFGDSTPSIQVPSQLATQSLNGTQKTLVGQNNNCYSPDNCQSSIHSVATALPQNIIQKSDKQFQMPISQNQSLNNKLNKRFGVNKNSNISLSSKDKERANNLLNQFSDSQNQNMPLSKQMQMGGLGVNKPKKSPNLLRQEFNDDFGSFDSEALNDTQTLKKIMPNIKQLSQVCHLTTKDSSQQSVFTDAAMNAVCRKITRAHNFEPKQSQFSQSQSIYNGQYQTQESPSEFMNKRDKKSSQKDMIKQEGSISIEDIDVNSKMRFQIDKDLAAFLDIDQWCSFREITLGFLKFNKKTKGDFYDRSTTSFNAYKYPYFLQFFPHLLDVKLKKQQKITNLDLRKYLFEKQRQLQK